MSPAKAAERPCRWFLYCTNRAVTVIVHPILGRVPVCDRCLKIYKKAQ